MAKYLNKDAIQDLIKIRNNIFPERTRAFEQYQVDVLDNDTLSSLSVWEIVSQYDRDYNTNFARNGEDAVSNNIIIEQKCSNVMPTKKGVVGKAAFQFHAMGKLEYPRYILTVRRKDTLQPVRLYDISKEQNVKMISDHLLAEREKWLAKGQIDAVKNMKRDVITLPESLILDNIQMSETTVINNCIVSKD